MVNALFVKLAFRELRKNFVQYLATFLITLLAVTLFLGFISNSLTLERRAERYYEETCLADLVVQTTGLTAEDVNFLDGYGAEYRIYSEGSFSKEGGTPDTAKIYVTDGAINAPYITEGEKGVLIDARVAEMKGYAVGDEIDVSCSTLKAAFATQGIVPEFRVRITGLMHSVEIVNVYSVSPLLLTPAVFEDKIVELAMEKYGFDPSNESLESMVRSVVQASLPRLRSQAVIRADDPARAKEEISARFNGKEENNLVTVLDHDTMEAVVTIQSEADQSLNMIYVFPVIFFVVSLLVVVSTITRLILRERTYIGTFKALGIGNGRIVLHYALLSALITLVGGALGAVLGPLIVPNVMSIKYSLMFSMPLELSGVVFSPLWTVVALLIVCGTSFLIGVCVSRSVVSENPAECMRPKAAGYHPRPKKGAGMLDPRAGLSFRMALRNLRINWGRAALTVVGIAGCSALLLTSFGIGDTLEASVRNDFGKLFTFDVIAPCTDEVEAKLAELGDVRVERVDSYIAAAEGKDGKGKDVTVYILPENSTMCAVVSGRNALSLSVAEDLGVKEGDTVLFTVGGKVYAETVEKVVQTSAWNGFFSVEELFEAEPASVTAWIATSAPEAVRDSLNEAAGMNVAKTMADRVEEIENIISSTNTMKYTLMVFAILLSVVVLYNLSLLNVRERTRDMATMKVLGFTHLKIALSLIYEIMLLTVIGTAIGCACGFPLLTLVMRINRVSVMSFCISLNAVSYVYAVLLSLGTSIAINLTFGLMISKISMTESLKSVE